MTIYGVCNPGAGCADGVRGAQAPGSPSQRPQHVAESAGAHAVDTVALSPEADALSRLASLGQSHPAELHGLSREMANKLHPRLEGESDQAWLERLSDRLARVAESGDLRTATLDRASAPPTHPEVQLRGGRGDGAELAWAGLLAQIGDAMANAQQVASARTAHSAKVVDDADKVSRVAASSPDSGTK